MSRSLTTLEFSAMVQQYQSLVYTVCHQLVPDVGDAQDLTQETFLAAWRAIDRCPSGFEKQWLACIAANKAKDYLRSAWVRRVNTPRSARGAVMGTIWVRLMQNTWGRAAVAAVAAVLALTMWRTGTLEQILSTGETVRSWLPETTQTTEPEQLGRPVQDDERTPTQPEQLGKPVQDKEPVPTLSQKLTGTLDSLLFGKNESAAEPEAAVSNQKK